MGDLDDIEYGLTVMDPWAQAIIWGPKRIENRTWKPPKKVIGDRIAVGVSKTTARTSVWVHVALRGLGQFDEESRHHPGHVIGTVRVVGYWHAIPKAECEQDYSGTDVSGPVVQEHIGDREWGCDHDPDRDDWWQGPIGWLLDDPQPIDDPVPVRGMPGVWDLDQQLKEK